MKNSTRNQAKGKMREMKGRVKDDDASVPQKDGAFVYWNAFDPGAEYRKWYRRPAGAFTKTLLLMPRRKLSRLNVDIALFSALNPK